MSMSISVKSHKAQRRPAMIPADAELTSEDRQAIRLRTGRFPVILHPAVAAAAARGLSDKEKPKMIEDEIRKRKASTTSEQYRERCGENVNQSRSNSNASQQR